MEEGFDVSAMQDLFVGGCFCKCVLFELCIFADFLLNTFTNGETLRSVLDGEEIRIKTVLAFCSLKIDFNKQFCYCTLTFSSDLHK